MSIGIGFEIMRGSGATWRGGAIHFANWMHALRLTFPHDARLYLVEALHGTPPPEELLPLVERVVSYPTLKRFSAQWVLNHAQRRLFKTDLQPDRVLRAQGVDTLICGVLERTTSLPTFALLTDFQHRHLPEFFDASEIAWRDAAFAKTAARATGIIVSGENVRADVEKFAPQFAHQVSIVPPTTFIPPEIYARSPHEILDAYTLPRKFVYLPNQFWQHKNHLRAFEAVRQLKQRGEEIFLVCTGYGGDSRNLLYFSQVLQTISQWGLRDNIALLGSVPRADVFALIRQAAFVLNPSRFEGYGLSLDEARSVGKRALVSDLPAHREQDAPCVEYFDPQNANELAEKLSAMWQNSQPGPDEELEARARAEQPTRMRVSAETLMQMVKKGIA